MADSYTLEVPAFGLTLELNRLRRERNELIGELVVRCTRPEIPTIGNHIVHMADFNLSSTRARTERIKVLKDRIHIAGLDLFAAFEDLVYHAFESERAGTGVVDLRTVPKQPPDQRLTCFNLAFPKRQPTILFGDGDSGKSYFALYYIGELAKKGMRVGYFDWEWDQDEHRDRLERLFGHPMPVIQYCRCERPLHYEADRLRQVTNDCRLEYAVFDSVAVACDGPPEVAESAARYFRALGTLGIGSAHIAHVTKSDQGDLKPYGSVFWHNLARCTYFVKSVVEERRQDRLDMGFYNRKRNSGPRGEDVGISIRFTDGRAIVSPTRLIDEPELMAKMFTKDKLLSALKGGRTLSVNQLSEMTGVRADTIVRTRRRHPGIFIELDDGRLVLTENADMSADSGV